MKISVLIENTTHNNNLLPEHGISLYIETNNTKLLFDTGQSGKFIQNADTMGISLQDVDMVILSHGHYDHAGGLSSFLKYNAKAPVFLHKNAFGQHFHGEKYIGLDPELLNSDRLIFTDGTFPLKENITLSPLPHSALTVPINPYGLSVKINGKLFPEDFSHEQYLLIEENSKKILFSGCSHKGIVNIIRYFQPDIMVGGLHFKDIPLNHNGYTVLQQYAECLCAYPIKYYVGQCTGEPQFDYIQPFFGKNITYIYTGTTLII